MTTRNAINLLVIEADRLYAERLATLLANYYKKVNLGWVDDRKGLSNTLRQPWDVLVFGQIDDMSANDIVEMLQQLDGQLPLICLSKDNQIAIQTQLSQQLPTTIESGMIKTLPAAHETEVVLAICLLEQMLKNKQQSERLRQQLSAVEQRLKHMLATSDSAVAYLNQDLHVFVNDAYRQLLGYDSAQVLLGVPVGELIVGADKIKALQQRLRQVDTQQQFNKDHLGQVEFDCESRRRDGSTVLVKVQLTTASFEGEAVTQITLHPKQSAAHSANPIKATTLTDNLTGLDNRQGFEATLTQAYTRLGSADAPTALLYIGLDNIDSILCDLGLQGFDSTIRQIADMLQQHFSSHYVSRFGDGTFAVLMSQVDKVRVLQQAQQLCQRVASMLINVAKRSVTTTVSIGVVMLDSNAPSQPVIIERAIAAMNQVKAVGKHGGNGVHFYDPGQHATRDNVALAEYLHHAISQNRFQLLYQPVYDIVSDRSDIFAVYLRLPLADGKTMTPPEFLEVAKSSQLLEKIDRWVLLNACKRLSQLRQRYPESRVIVQLTSASLVDKSLVSIVSQLLQAVGGTSGALTLQFHEQDVMDYLAVAQEQFCALREMNCQLSMHNFGVSGKSLQTAAFVKPDMVCLAKSLIEGLINNAANIEKVQSLVAELNAQGFAVLMPFIEDAATMSAAWGSGARYLQGYYLQQPSDEMQVSQ